MMSSKASITGNEDAMVLNRQAKIVIARCSAFIADLDNNHDSSTDFEICADFLDAISWLLSFETTLSVEFNRKLFDLRDNLTLFLRSQKAVKATKNWPKVANISSTISNSIESNIPQTNDASSAMKITQLLQDQKDIHGREVIVEKKAQEKHLTDLTYLTDSLKQTTLSINQAVKTQTMQLDMIQQYALENSVELELQKKRLAERTESAKSSVCSSFLNVLWIIMTFVGTYIIIRLFSQPQLQQCPNR
jgi:hypothetical protein